MEKISVWARIAVRLSGSKENILNVIKNGIANNIEVSVDKTDDHYIPYDCAEDVTPFEEGGKHGDCDFRIGEGCSVSIDGEETAKEMKLYWVTAVDEIFDTLERRVCKEEDIKKCCYYLAHDYNNAQRFYVNRLSFCFNGYGVNGDCVETYNRIDVID